MSNIKSGEMFNSYSCQAVTVVVQFILFCWHRHVRRLRRVSMGVDGWLSADSGVRVSRAGVV